jgi:hypothetical protein
MTVVKRPLVKQGSFLSVDKGLIFCAWNKNIAQRLRFKPII